MVWDRSELSYTNHELDHNIPLQAAVGDQLVGDVDLELAMLVDASDSVNGTEYTIQMNGYIEAFRDDAAVAQMLSGPNGKIAVMLMVWSSSGDQAIVDWVSISNDGEAEAFADAIAVLKDKNGCIVGGVITSMLVGVMHLEVLWVDEKYRRHGYGKALVLEAERIGKKIVHESAFSEPTLQLSGNISEGSFFRNGEVTLEFKGLSIVDDVACAIVGFDSGDSSFKFHIKPTPDMEIKTVGASHYWGDLYIELESRWVRKYEMGELTVSKVTLKPEGYQLRHGARYNNKVNGQRQIREAC